MNPQVSDAMARPGGNGGHGAFARELLRTSDLETLAHVAAREAHRQFGLSRLVLLWWSRATLPGGSARLLVAPAGAASADEREWLQRYERALDMLKPADREAIIGRLELGYSYEQLAEVLQRPTAEAARLAVRRALLRLAEIMEANPSDR